jgi:hypothetical protein
MGRAPGDDLVRAKRKSVALPTPADLSCASATFALEILNAADEGWADIAVHQSDIRLAIKVAAEHNAKKPAVMLRVTTDTTIPRNEWRLRSKSAEVRSA